MNETLETNATRQNYHIEIMEQIERYNRLTDELNVLIDKIQGSKVVDVISDNVKAPTPVAPLAEFLAGGSTRVMDINAKFDEQIGKLRGLLF